MEGGGSNLVTECRFQWCDGGRVDQVALLDLVGDVPWTAVDSVPSISSDGCSRLKSLSSKAGCDSFVVFKAPPLVLAIDARGKSVPCLV